MPASRFSRKRAREASQLAGPVEAGNPRTINVNGDTEVLAANSKRVTAWIVNDSDIPIYLQFGVAAVVGEGVRLNAQGGALTINRMCLYTGLIRANHNGGAVNKVLTVTELVSS